MSQIVIVNTKRITKVIIILLLLTVDATFEVEASILSTSSTASVAATLVSSWFAGQVDRLIPQNFRIGLVIFDVSNTSPRATVRIVWIAMFALAGQFTFHQFMQITNCKILIIPHRYFNESPSSIFKAIVDVETVFITTFQFFSMASAAAAISKESWRGNSI